MNWGLISVVVTIGVALIIWVRRRYFTRPELTIELKFDGGHSMQLGTSINQGQPDEIAGTIDRPIHIFDAEKALRIWEKKWKMDLFIRNNSDHTAYYPKIHFDKQKVGFTHVKPLNSQIPIGSKQEIVLKAEYIELEEAAGRNRTQVNGLPPALDDLKVCLEYKNGFKRTYYSVYNNRTKLTEFKRKLNSSFLWKI